MVIRIAVLFLCMGFMQNLHAQQIDRDDLSLVVQNLNSRYDEQNPILSPDGRQMYFTRANDSLNIGGTKDKGDIWVSELGKNGIWQKPVNIGAPVNDPLKNYILGFSPDGKIMFLNQEKKNPGGLIINDGIAFSTFSGGKWSKPMRLSVDYLLNKSKHQSGSLSADGTLLLLSIQGFASKGEEDIYISTYENGKWSQPVNLGSDINTSGQELTAYLSPDKTKLYFSSNGHGGKGGIDLYVSERQDDSWKSWSKPKNLGSGFNSIGVEMNYFMDLRNSVAYFSSTQNSDGYGDIKAVDIEITQDEIIDDTVAEEAFEELAVIAEEAKKTLVLSGHILDAKTNEPIAAAMKVSADGNDQSINSDETSGSYEVELPPAFEQVTVNVKAPGYMSVIEQIQIEGEDLKKDFSLVPLEVGETIQLDKVYFERGTAVLLEESFAELNQLAEMLNENPSVKIELSGHTDNQGNSKLNLILSRERVEKVEMYLTEHGVEGNRIKGKGYGGTKPISSNASEETRKLNRRVEITILKN